MRANATRAKLALTVAMALALLPAAPAARASDTEPVEDAAEEAAEAPRHADIEGGGHGEHHGAAAPHRINWIEWHKGKDLNGGALHPAEDAMPAGLLFALVNFAVFFGLLVKFVGPKIGLSLRKRHELVREQLAESARLRQEARDKLEEFNRRVSGVDAEVQTLMSEIRAEAEAEKEMILGQARAQAEAMKRDAERRIESEVARARAILEREVVAAAVGAAEKILRERTTADDQARLFDGFVDSMLTGGGPDKPKTDQGWG